MNDDDHHGVDIDNDNGFMDGLPHGETDPDGPMGGHGDSQALPTVLCVPEAAAPWVPVTSPIPGLTALLIGAQVMDFPLPTDVPTLATHPPHGETDPDGPMGGAGASDPRWTSFVSPLQMAIGHYSTCPVDTDLTPRRPPPSNKPAD